MIKPYYESKDGYFILYRGDCLKILSDLEENVDIVITDPPYFLSNDGTTCKSGKMVSVNKGKWDKGTDINKIHEFNTSWIKGCQRTLKPNGTMWVFGTQHNIFSVGMAMKQLEMKVLNDIIWKKTAPPPNLACRTFTHSTEIILWAAKNKKSKYTFNYADMKKTNSNKQMKNVWEFNTAGKKEKLYGKHPTQKPEALIERLVLASSKEGDLIIDPFCGSGTTGVVARRLGRKFIGIEKDKKYLNLAIKRFEAGNKDGYG
jgi:site-specific DNA-methyltransferase (adenine-specific)